MTRKMSTCSVDAGFPPPWIFCILSSFFTHGCMCQMCLRWHLARAINCTVKGELPWCLCPASLPLGRISGSEHSWPSRTPSCPALVTLGFLLMLGSASHKGKCCEVWRYTKRPWSCVPKTPVMKNGSGGTLGLMFNGWSWRFCCIWWLTKLEMFTNKKFKCIKLKHRCIKNMNEQRKNKKRQEPWILFILVKEKHRILGQEAWWSAPGMKPEAQTLFLDLAGKFSCLPNIGNSLRLHWKEAH